jgi:NADH:ubiquinone oxidoreductase subunit K
MVRNVLTGFAVWLGANLTVLGLAILRAVVRHRRQADLDQPEPHNPRTCPYCYFDMSERVS